MMFRAMIVASGFFLASSSAAVANEIPPKLYSQPGQLATFVRIDTAVTPGGKIDSSLFSESEADAIRTYMKLPEENGCVRLRGLIRDYVNAGPLSSPEEAAQKARLVLVGTVKALAQGFSGSEAGTLLEIEPSEILKGSLGGNPSSAYVFFPIANFRLKGRSFCATNPDWPALPNLGDRLLVFVRNYGSASGSYLPLLDGSDVIVMRETGIDFPPRFYVDGTLKNLTGNGLVEKVRSYVGGKERP